MEKKRKEKIKTLLHFMDRIFCLLNNKAGSMQEMYRWNEELKQDKFMMQKWNVTPNDIMVAVKVYNLSIKKNYYDHHELTAQDLDILLNWKSIDFKFDVQVSD